MNYDVMDVLDGKIDKDELSLYSPEDDISITKNGDLVTITVETPVDSLEIFGDRVEITSVGKKKIIRFNGIPMEVRERKDMASITYRKEKK